jgi:hypothetical protein
MCDDLYLILHKVRGEPAFDIAEEIQIGDDERGWIIPTSGHRAYPAMMWALEDLREVNNDEPVAILPPSSVADLPDHYTANPSPKRSILSFLGLAGPKPPKSIRGLR